MCVCVALVEKARARTYKSAQNAAGSLLLLLLLLLLLSTTGTLFCANNLAA